MEYFKFILIYSCIGLLTCGWFLGMYLHFIDRIKIGKKNDECK